MHYSRVFPARRLLSSNHEPTPFDFKATCKSMARYLLNSSQNLPIAVSYCDQGRRVAQAPHCCDAFFEGNLYSCHSIDAFFEKYKKCFRNVVHFQNFRFFASPSFAASPFPSMYIHFYAGTSIFISLRFNDYSVDLALRASRRPFGAFSMHISHPGRVCQSRSPRAIDALIYKAVHF